MVQSRRSEGNSIPSLRLAALRGAIRGRLTRVCANWADDDVDALVERIAATTIKYERIQMYVPVEGVNRESEAGED
jgi:hypothetical protein